MKRRNRPNGLFARRAGQHLPCAARQAITFDSGKLILTNGVTTIRGQRRRRPCHLGATISGMGTGRAVRRFGARHRPRTARFPLDTHGLAIGVHDRVELAYARQNFNTRQAGAALGLGRGFQFDRGQRFGQSAAGGRSRLWPRAAAAISVGAEHKRGLDGGLVRAVGARQSVGTDFTLSATKLFLGAGVFASATVRFTKADRVRPARFRRRREERRAQRDSKARLA